jgi:sugar phosphate isomerase/epimerase
MPLLIPEAARRTVRTPPLPTVDALREAVKDLRELVAEAGRPADAVAVQVEGGPNGRMDLPVPETVERLQELVDAGATGVVLDPPNPSLDAAVDILHRYATEVVPRLR